MDIRYLNPNLRELNDKLRVAFADTRGLSTEEVRHCRWIAMNMRPATTDISASQRDLVNDLQEIIGFAGRNLDGIVGWCMAASHEPHLQGSPREIDAAIREFVLSHIPSAANVLDVAAGTGRRSLPLAEHGCRLSLYEPAAAFLHAAYRNATSQGIEKSIADLICGSFNDLPKIKDNAYDLSLCFEAVLYARHRRAAEDVLTNLARISSRGVVFDVASKYGMLLQLADEGAAVSAKSIRRLLNTGVTPPASAENGHAVYSCFSSEELLSMLNRFGFKVEGLIGHGSPGTLDEATSKLLSACERKRIEEYLQAEEPPIDLFPNMLVLCVKE